MCERVWGGVGACVEKIVSAFRLPGEYESTWMSLLGFYKDIW